MAVALTRWVAVACMVLLISSVTAVPYQASESVKDYLDTDTLAKSLTVDITPTIGPDGKPTVGVTLGSTDARYQALNGKSFVVDPKKTDGGIDIAVDTKGAGVDQLLSGKRVHIPSTLGGVDLSDPSAIDSPEFDRIVASEVTDLVADVPVSHGSIAVTGEGVGGPGMSYIPVSTYRQAIENALFTTTSEDGRAGTASEHKQSWWQWTKEKCKAAWKATKEFVKEHWLLILIVVLAVIIVTVIVLMLLVWFGAPPPATAPVVHRVVYDALVFVIMTMPDWAFGLPLPE